MKKIIFIMLILMLSMIAFAEEQYNWPEPIEHNEYDSPEPLDYNDYNWPEPLDHNEYDSNKKFVACTMEYDPVCGEIEICAVKKVIKDDGTTYTQEGICNIEKKTFSNKCVAESRGAKVLYEGECEKPQETNNEETPNENNEICTMEYDPVCGEIEKYTINNTTNQRYKEYHKKTFSNKCVAESRGAKVLYEGECENNSNEETPTPILERETNCQQNYEEIRKIKDSCNYENGQILTDIDSRGCSIYKCVPRKDDINICRTINDIPKEKKISCERNGGQFVTRTNEKGCLTVIDCIHEKKEIDRNNIRVNKNILTNKTALLGMALKIENLKIEFSKISNKLEAIGKYYEDNNNEDANNFYIASEKSEEAIAKLDEIKEMIKENVDNFDEEKGKEVRIALAEIKENILRDILLSVLG